jgi:hypothetical protein
MEEILKNVDIIFIVTGIKFNKKKVVDYTPKKRI